MRSAIAASCVLALVMPSPTAQAFCGFYVSGSNKKMFNDATNVVLMRSGTRTVLAMQNDYRGPLENFAMVVPVPVVLKESDVRVVPRTSFDRIDSLSSPRLVEYWEKDPCPPEDVITVIDSAPTIDPTSTTQGITIDKQYLRNIPVPGRSYDASLGAPRPAIAPILASFTLHPPTVTAGKATPMTWSFAFSNNPWPEPSCTVDHGVGVVHSGVASPLTLNDSSDVTLTCKNAGGSSSKKARVNVVKVESEFEVEEYKIVILSAKEATGLDSWLKLNGYKIPEGAEALLRPYVESGSKFFVAKVDPTKVKMVDGRVALSPLRFHYDSDEFALPIRLGLANSSGKQDLIINIVSPDKRYEVANYKNAMIPTNFNVLPVVKDRFAEFYGALFDKTLEANPGAVITEYAWTSVPAPQGVFGAKCDPCPPEIPEDADMIRLGADVIGGNVARGGYVLTRLHARYGASDMKDDLRFREAKPITGGREVMTGAWLEYGATPADRNFFQARYAIRHWWTGPIHCSNPKRQVWGGPPHGGVGPSKAIAAKKVAFAPRGGVQLASVILRDLWEINFKRAVPAAPPAARPATPAAKGAWFGLGALAGLMLLIVGLRRRET